MAVIQDPQGGFFMVWEPKLHIGASSSTPTARCPGTSSPPRIWTPRPSSTVELFGWEAEPFEGMELPYRIIQNAGHSNGGMRAPQQNEPTYWLVYFGTDDIDASLAKSTELGGNTLMGPMDIGMGKIAVLQDPQGAVFALYAGDFDD